MRAAISAPKPDVSESSWATRTRPVFRTEAKMPSQSQGASEREIQPRQETPRYEAPRFERQETPRFESQRSDEG